MSALANLISIAAGERPRGGLTQTCRLQAYGAEVYGEEQIVMAFRAVPFASKPSRQIVQTPDHLAIIETDRALVADISGEVITRIWRLDEGAPLEREASVSLPFDPDLNQARGDLNWCASDHPHADAAVLELLAKAGAEMARSPGDTANGTHRTRTFLIRAFSEGQAGVGLFAVHRMSGDRVRVPGWSYALIHVAPDAAEPALVRDASGDLAAEQTPWRVCLV